MTVSEALARAARRLAAAGVPTPELDAELLLRHALDWDRARLIADAGRPLSEPARERFEALLAGRARRLPLQHLVGSVEFYGRRFRVSPAALIPRPETELLVEAAIAEMAVRNAPLAADVGTGCGCIALTLAAERPDATIHAIDSSPPALALAAENRATLGLAGRVVFHHGDLLQPLAALAGRFDLVVSNPPYLDAAEVAGLEPEVRDHEPRDALVPADNDRYSAYRRLAREAPPLLRPGGLLLVEIGFGMEAVVRQAFGDAGLALADTRPDYQGIPRVVAARR